jgi:hypothetical protein
LTTDNDENIRVIQSFRILHNRWEIQQNPPVDNSRAEKFRAKRPSTVGVPRITPLDGANDSPAGSEASARMTKEPVVFECTTTVERKVF